MTRLAADQHLAAYGHDPMLAPDADQLACWRCDARWSDPQAIRNAKRCEATHPMRRAEYEAVCAELNALAEAINKSPYKERILHRIGMIYEQTPMANGMVESKRRSLAVYKRAIAEATCP
jgi:hypothetical protein